MMYIGQVCRAAVKAVMHSGLLSQQVIHPPVARNLGCSWLTVLSFFGEVLLEGGISHYPVDQSVARD
jgi:hypothetical protein